MTYKNLKTFFIIIVCLGPALCVQAQMQKFPEVGEKMPPFTLKLHGKNTLSSEHLKGKHYILDFWNIGCFACIQSFPKMDELQQKYADSLKIILVGLEDKRRDIRSIYGTYEKKLKLKLTSAYDSAAFKRFVPFSVPHLIWVDSAGVIAAITMTPDVTDANVQKFLKGEKFSFLNQSYATMNTSKASLDYDKPLLIDGNGGDEKCYSFRTVITPWNPNVSSPNFPDIPSNITSKTAHYQVIGARVEELFNIAFYGTLLFQRSNPNSYPLPQLSESAIELLNKRFPPQQRFNLSIEMPVEVATRKSMMNAMKNELCAFFGFSASLKEKEIPCYALIIHDQQKFQSNTKVSGRRMGTWLPEEPIHTFNNMAVDDIITTIGSRIINPGSILIFNQTGYEGNLSLSFKANITDLSDIKKGLKHAGLDLVPIKKIMNVIEITEGL